MRQSLICPKEVEAGFIPAVTAELEAEPHLIGGKFMDKDLNIVKELHKVLDSKFAQDIKIMDLREISPIADFFVITTAGSAPQMVALAEYAEETLTEHGLKLFHREGVQTAKWVLLDFGSIIIHIFDKESRDYYNLERTWGDAPVVNTDE